MKAIHAFWFLLLTGYLVSCSSDSSQAEELLIGRWEIQSATRNGKSTALLQSVFFEFYEDGSMRTNLPASEAEASYEVSKNMILQKDTPKPMEFEIVSIVDSSLILRTKVSDFEFLLDLKKRIPEN